MAEFVFKEKSIIILSPEKWGPMRFSKHHYALELAQMGNTVYFVEPPNLDERGIQIRDSEETHFLKIISYKPVYRGERFLPDWLFRILLKLQVSKILNKMGGAPDVIWCFDPYRFRNLNWFKARIKIFFLADLLSKDKIPEEACTSDLCLAVSNSRVRQLEGCGRPVYFINHGLSRYYIQNSNKSLKEIQSVEPGEVNRITAGYIGNLLMEALDRKTMREVICANPDVKFIFWGQYKPEGQLVAFNRPETFAFISFLEKQPNVDLRGPIHPKKLSEEIKQANLFWVCWKIGISKMWDGSNPHKILEYLSTGKPVITHYLESYQGRDEIDMLKSESNSGYLLLFNSVKERLMRGESKEIQDKRINLAIQNSYAEQIERVRSWINDNVFWN